ncbi:MAG: Kazal-type serine protease inhibitor domain-containing protein [Polyangiaceae bacterium]
MPRAQGCPLIYHPVCGCDGHTHGNACGAAMSGVSVASDGECPSADAAVCRDGETKKVDCNTCTCRNGVWGCTIIACPPPIGTSCTERQKTCAASEYCDYPKPPTCYQSGAAGFCTPRPTDCGDIAAPVCGCDLKEYINACEAARAGTGIFGPGRCPPDAR